GGGAVVDGGGRRGAGNGAARGGAGGGSGGRDRGRRARGGGGQTSPPQPPSPRPGPWISVTSCREAGPERGGSHTFRPAISPLSCRVCESAALAPCSRKAQGRGGTGG